MIGIGPIERAEVDDKARVVKDFETAKLEVVRDHLRHYYKYNEQEIKQMTIAETKMGKDVIYIAVEDEVDIRDLYKRKAECRREDTFLRMYVPPQLWDRISAINKLCQEKRNNDKYLKTQLRYGTVDLEILTKEKGSEEPFRQVNLTDFIGETVLPTFDHTIKWRRLVDRPTRRRVTSSRSPSPDPANRKVSPQKPQLNKQLRQLSLTGKDTSVNKRQRQNEMDTTEDLNITQ